MLIEPPLDLAELADRTGVSPRTIRYYIQEGLLPSPEARGPGAHYGPEHLERLKIIKRLQREHLPLAEIRRLLEEAGENLAALSAMSRAPSHRRTSAQEYIRGVLGSPATESRVFSMSSPMRPIVGEAGEAGREVRSAHRTRSQWERITLAPDVELHVRRPLSRTQNKQVDGLLQAAREIFQEEAP